MVGVDLKRAIHGAFGRSSSAIALVIILAFAVMILATAYHVSAFTPAEFLKKPEVQKYENAVENVSAMDDWTRTRYYWSNNLRVAGILAIGTPIYLGLNSVVAANYSAGMALTYYCYHPLYGPRAMLAFSAQIFVHGLLELTGVYIIAAASLRVAWNLWKGLGHLMATGVKKKRWSWGLFEWEKLEILKHKAEIESLLVDFIVLFAIGAFLIFLAAPIEAYVSPTMGGIFYVEPLFAGAFVVAVGFFYGAIVARGFRAMRMDLKLVWKDVELGLRGKWRSTQLSLLVLALFFFLGLSRLAF